MTSSSLAGIITAIATVITAIGGVLAALALLLPTLRETRRVSAKTSEIHVMVNQQRTDAKNYNNALIAALNAAGVAVPADQSLTPPDVPA